jgi:ABC-type Fe3+ transport system permease subunit
MELDNLKSIWQDISRPTETLDAQAVRTLLKGKTQDALSKINRSIRLEAGACVLFTLIFSGATFFISSATPAFLSVVIFAICALSVIYYYFKYRQINQITLTSASLRDSLTKLIRVIETYLRIYFWAIIWLTPISIITGYLYGMFARLGEEKLPTTVLASLILFGGVFTIIVSLLMYPFMRWYLKLLYGQYLKDLKDCLQELNAPNQE